MIANFKKKPKNFSLLNGILLKLGIVLILLVFILLAFANISNYRKRNLLISQINALEEKIEGIKKENEKIAQNIQKVNDDKYVEKVAREELDLQKPGEKVYSFIRTAEQQNNEEQAKPASGWFGWLGGAWNWLKNRF